MNVPGTRQPQTIFRADKEYITKMGTQLKKIIGGRRAGGRGEEFDKFYKLRHITSKFNILGLCENKAKQKQQQKTNKKVICHS